jgi:hypothetical protein
MQNIYSQCNNIISVKVYTVFVDEILTVVNSETAALIKLKFCINVA